MFLWFHRLSKITSMELSRKNKFGGLNHEWLQVKMGDWVIDLEDLAAFTSDWLENCP